MRDYSDIINIPYRKSLRRQRMTKIERAAQFSSFAALVGYEDAVEETARLTDAQLDLSDTALDTLNRKLQIVKEHIKEHPQVSIIHFVPDDKKEGGTYHITKGTVKKIDDYTKGIFMCEGTQIPMDTVADIDGEIFDGMYL